MPKDFYSLCEHCYVEEIEDEWVWKIRMVTFCYIRSNQW
jgi:hypothetical protein